MKDVTALSILPNGDLIVATFKGLFRLDGATQEVRAKRVAPLPAFAVARDGKLFIADGNKVFEADATTLKLGKRVLFPADRGGSGALSELAVSPDGTILAGITRAGTLHLQALGAKTSESHGAYGARRESLGFVGPSEAAHVHGNTLIDMRSLGGRPREISGGGVSFAVAGEGILLGWGVSSDKLSIIDAAKEKVVAKIAVPEDGNGLSAALVPGASMALVSSGKKLTLIDTKARKVKKQIAFASPGVMAATKDRLAIAVNDEIAVLDVPSLEIVSGKAAAPPPKKAAPARAPKEKKEPTKKVKAHASAYREKIEAFVEKLRATKGITIDRVEMGGAASETTLKAAEKKLGHALPKDFRAAWHDVDGFSISWGRGQGVIGVNSLAQILATPSEDQLWNDQYDEQSGTPGTLPLAKLKKLSVLWSLPGESPAVGVDLRTKEAKLYFGEPNEVFPLPLTLEEYIELALATGSRFQDAFVGDAKARKRGRAYVEQRMVPSWKKPTWAKRAQTG